MNILFIFACLALVLTYAQADCQGEIQWLDEVKYAHARCLDSSKSGYYFQSATSSVNATKWVISFEGGGECVTQRSCTTRSKTALGSSTEWDKVHAWYGFLVCDRINNPDFHDWNHVFVPYCSGDLFLGQDEQTSDRAWGLRFSGYHIASAVLDDLIVRGLNLASHVVVSGESAGGIGAVALADFIFDHLYTTTTTNPQPYQIYTRVVDKQSLQGPRVTLIPIAGYYFSNSKYVAPAEGPAAIGYIKWAYADLKVYKELWNAFVPKRCSEDGRGEIHECIFASRSYVTLATEAFFVHSQNDATIMPLHAGLPPVWKATDGTKSCNNTMDPCPAGVLNYLRQWNKDMWTALTPVLTQQNTVGQHKVGLFVPACLIHTEFGLKKPLINGRNVMQVVNAWLWDTTSTNNHIHIDRCGDGNVLCGNCGTV